MLQEVFRLRLSTLLCLATNKNSLSCLSKVVLEQELRRQSLFRAKVWSITTNLYTFISFNLILPNLICCMPPIVDSQVAQYIAGTFGHMSMSR